MMQLRRLTAVLIVLAVCTVGCDRSDSSAELKGSVSDLTTPRAAAKSFTLALARGDAGAARNAILDPDKYGPTTDSMAAMATSIKSFGDAAAEKFGSAARNLADTSAFADIGRNIDKADVKLDGDSATIAAPSTGEVSPSSPDQAVILKKIGDEWKVDLAAMDPKGKLLQTTPAFRLYAQATDEVAGEIKSGTIRSLAEAEAVLQKKWEPILRGGSMATTLPAEP